MRWKFLKKSNPCWEMKRTRSPRNSLLHFLYLLKMPWSLYDIELRYLFFWSSIYWNIIAKAWSYNQERLLILVCYLLKTKLISLFLWVASIFSPVWKKWHIAISQSSHLAFFGFLMLQEARKLFPSFVNCILSWNAQSLKIGWYFLRSKKCKVTKETFFCSLMVSGKCR